MTEVKLANPDNFEVLVGVANLKGYSRKLLIIACYIPPNYIVGRGKECLAYIEDVLLEVKRRYRDPFIVLGATIISGASKT